MKHPTVLEAMKNLTVLKFTPHRDRPGGTAILRLPGKQRAIEASWLPPAKGQPVILNFRPYPDGWERLPPTERAAACKEAWVAIETHRLKTQRQKAPRATNKRPR